jgi:hypothetical protein
MNTHGQSLDYDYRSTEVWKQQGRQWRMISSQTLTVQRDPPAVPLAAQALEDFATCCSRPVNRAARFFSAMSTAM